jgi:hypothetical protein
MLQRKQNLNRLKTAMVPFLQNSFLYILRSNTAMYTPQTKQVHKPEQAGIP